jgi:hypothetical protein
MAPTSSPRRIARLIVVLAMIQTAVSFVLSLLTFASAMHRFDNGGEPTPVEQLFSAAAQLFAFPILTLARSLELRFPGLWGWVPFILNGLVWSSVAVLVLIYRRRRSVMPSSRPERA